MSVASGDQPGATEPRHIGLAVCQFKCILCRQRFWKKNVLVRRSAKCRGTRFNTDGTRWKCKAWRCRFNDQCPNANSACPICGAYKPPESRPTLPAPETNPAITSRSASSADPNPALASHDPAIGRIDRLSRSIYGHSEGNDEWQRYFENGLRLSDSKVQAQYVDDLIVSELQDEVPAGTVTQLPLYGGVISRHLTEV